MRLLRYILTIFILCATPSIAQSIYSTSGGVSPCLDFVLGECFTEHTQPVEIGFLSGMYYSSISSEKQLTDTAAIQVHFDNELHLATIFMSHELTTHSPQYRISGMDGRVYIPGRIVNMPQFVQYSQLLSGIYILHISGIPGRIPYTTKWLKTK